MNNPIENDIAGLEKTVPAQKLKSISDSVDNWILSSLLIIIYSICPNLQDVLAFLDT